MNWQSSKNRWRWLFAILIALPLVACDGECSTCDNDSDCDGDMTCATFCSSGGDCEGRCADDDTEQCSG